MTLTNVIFQYDGEWKTNEQGVNEWCPRSNAGWGAMIVDNFDVTLQEVEDIICQKCGLSTNEIELKFSYIPLTPNYKSGPIYIHTSNCLKAFLYFGDVYSRPLLHVEFENKIQSSKSIMKDGVCFGAVADVDVDVNTDARGVVGENEDVFGFDVDVDVDVAPDEYCDNTFLANNVVNASSAIDKKNTSSTPSFTGNDKNVNEENVGEESVGEENMNTRSKFHHCKQLDDNDQNLLVLGAGSCGIFSFTDDSNLVIGQEFNSKVDVQIELQKIAMGASFDTRVLKSTKKLYSVRCMDDNCSWKVRASQIKNSARFSIRTYCNKHTCDLVNQRKRYKKASAALVANMLVKKFGEQTTSAPKAIRTMMQNNGVEISYFKAWKGKQLAMNQLRGDPDESFKLLPAYLYMLEQVNPGSITHFEIDSSGNFKYLFLAYSACISGFKYMRKVISVDSTSLKGKYKCVVLVATTQDGNHRQYPIAWAVVDTESETSWSWFFQKLQEFIPDDDEIVFISDIHQCIISGLTYVYKQAHHGLCVWHLAQNIKTRLKTKECGADLFIQTSKAYNESDFHTLYNELNSKYSNVTAYLENFIDKEKWSRAHFKVARYNIMTTYGSEFINAQLHSHQELPILALLDSIQHLVSNWFNKHRIAATASKLILTPWAEDIVHISSNESQKLTATPMNTCEFHVTGEGHDAVVDLFKKSCSCRTFDIDRLPCAHAIAAHEQTGMNLYDLCSDYYTTTTWALAYSETVYPVPMMNDWNIPTNISFIDVLPPKVKVDKSRGKKKKIPLFESL